jgi:gliding motility-associated-like protein
MKKKYSAIPLFAGTTKVFAMNGTFCMKRIANTLTGKAILLVWSLVFLFSYNGFSQTQNIPAAGPVSNNTTRFLSTSDVSPDIANMLNYYDKQVYFTENHGQWDSKVLYRADFKLGQAVATKEGMIVGTFDPAAVDAQSQWSMRQEAAHTSHTLFTEPEPNVKGNGWMMNFINHSPSMTVESQSKHKDVFNYFDGGQSLSNVNSYQEIWYNNVYDNVDVRYYPSKDGSLEYDMICKPGFDKDAISIKMDGISKVILKKDGSLDLKTSVGDMSLPTPVAYQNIDGKRVPVEAHYEVSRNNVVTFKISDFDKTKTLLIDPIALRWATWLNTQSTGANHAHCVWIDAAGNIYTVARVDGSTNLITTGAFDTTANGGIDLIIGKYTEPEAVGGSGTRVWQTYVGGSDDDNPYAAQMGPDGNLYITGYTASTNFPLIGGTAFSGPSIDDRSQVTDNIFVMKITPDGQSIKASVIGGNGDDNSYDLRFTSNGDVVVCGETESTNLATLFPGSGATNTTKSNYDVIVFRINSNLDTIKWMKNYGGSSSAAADVATIMLDNPVNDDIYVAGYTSSSNFPTTSNARQTSLVGLTSGFIQKLKSNGTTVWSSYFDAAKNDVAQILCMEFNTTYDKLYFGGVTTGLYTTSPTSNISTGAYQTKYGGNQDFFVASMDTNQTFVAGTYVGGSGQEINMMGLNTDQNNDVYILGYTSSTNFPTTSGALQTTNMAANSADNEVFLKLYTTLDSLEFSTYYGGTTDDYDPVGERGIKFSNCRIYTLVTSESNNIPLTKGALNTTKLSSSSIYEPGLVVWSNPPDLLNNTITGSQTVCKGSEPEEFTGSIPSYSLPTISRDNDTSKYPSVGSSTVYQWQSSTDSINWTNIPGGTTQNLDSTQIGPLTMTTYFRRIISGDACIIAGAAEQTVVVHITTVGGTVKNVTCNGANNGSITAVPTGPPHYKFTWSNGDTSQTISNLAPGTYTVTVVDGNSCSSTNSFIITQPTLLTVTIKSHINPTSCSGDNGSATANAATGGISPYTYKWTPSGGTGLTASNLTAGTYTITATDSNNCTATATVVINVPPSSLSASISSQTNVSCYGGNNGSATVKVSGGTLPYTYSWGISGKTSDTANNLAIGTYTVTVTDSEGCTTTATAIITQPQAALSASISAQTNVSCYGGNNGSATVSVTGGTTSYSYSWSPTGGSLAKASDLTAGTYTVTVTDANKCITIATAIITQPQTALSASISSQTNVLCYGGNNGSAIAAASGGTQPYSYSWNTKPAQTSDTANNLAAGTYTVTVTDSNGCIATTTAIITQPLAALSASISSKTNVSCFGGAGSASVSVSGGTQPYSYLWSTIPPQTTDTATSLSAGTYTVTVTDSNNCSTTASVIITSPTGALSAAISSQTNVSCYGGNNGSATVTASAGLPPYTYSWSNGPTTATDSGLIAGTYTVTVTDSGNCTTTAIAVITQPQAALSASISSQTNVSCYGDNNGSATVTASGGTVPYTYSWSPASGKTSDTANNLTAGTYTVTVTDSNGCTTTATAIITQPQAALSASISAQTNVSCYGGNNGSAMVTASGGTVPYTYLWSPVSGKTSDTANNLTAGTYTVTVTDSNGCTAIAIAIITQPQAALSASISSQTNVSCYGGNNGSAMVTASGGTVPYTYSWSPASGKTSDTANNLVAGTYTVTVTDSNGCMATAIAIISQPLAALSASISAQTNVSCYGGNNGSAMVTASGGTVPYTYSWSPASGKTSDTANNLTAGTYTVTVTDSNGCMATAIAIITQPQASLSASISAQTNVSCYGGNNGSAMVTASGGTVPYTYSWSPASGKTSDSANNLVAGTYTVTVTDSNGCMATAIAIITQPQAALSASISLQTNVLCYGGNNGSATVTVSGGTVPYTYLWSPASGKTSDTANNLTAGTYTVTVTDSNGCTTTATAIITQPLAALSTSVNVSSATICSGSLDTVSVSVSGGTGSYSYSWSPVEGNTDSITVNPSVTTTYTVTVTDANGCITTDSITINVNQSPKLGVTAIPSAICTGNNDTLSVSGAGSYTWSPSTGLSATTGSTITANPSVTTTYTVTGTNDNGCANTTTVTVNVNKLPTVSLSGLNPYYCSSAPSPVTLEGFPPAPAPYGIYSGNGVYHALPQFYPDSAGVGGPYTITYTYKNDTTGCINSASLPVTILPVPNVAVTPDSPAVCSGVGVTLEVSEPTPGTTYIWSPSTGLSSTSGTNVTSTAGSSILYTVTATSDSGCTGAVNTMVTVNSLPIITITPPPPGPDICLGDSITLNAAGGSSYIWTPSTGLSCATCSSTVASPTSTTEYILDVNNGRCSASDTVIVGVYSVTVKAGPDQHILYGSTAQLAASGSGAVYYRWSPGNTLSNDSISDPIASPTVTTVYTVTGSDSLGCISTDTLTIFVSSPCQWGTPSAFTPSASENRYFHILSNDGGDGGIQLLDFKVFNRWGQEMYQTTDLSALGWDGTWLGKDQPQDTYVYWAEVLCEGKINFIKGNVTLIR